MSAVVLKSGAVALVLCAAPALDALPAQAATSVPAGEATAPDAAGDGHDARVDDKSERHDSLLRGKLTGGYGGFGVGYSQVHGNPALLSGGEGGVIFDHRLVLGLVGYSTVDRIDVPDTADGTRLRMAYSGLVVRYHLIADSALYPSVGVVLGGGVVSRTTGNRRETVPDDFGDPFFAVEPQMTLYGDLFRWMRVGVQGGYRFVHEAQDYDGDLDGPTAAMLFQFGKL